METRECVVHGWRKERRKLTQHCEDRDRCERRCGVQRLPLWMLYVGLGGVVLGVGLDVVWLCVLIVVVPQNDLLLPSSQ